MAQITSRKLDPDTKMEVVYFEDKFGAKSQVQHVLARTLVQRAADEAAHLALLEANETAFDALKADRGEQ